MIDVAEARRRIIEAITPLAPEQIALGDGLGRVLATDVRSRRTQPPAAVSAMDGYAVQAADVAKLPATLKIIGEVPAGAAFEGEVGPGETVRIFTGATVPRGADAIVIQENTTRHDDQVDVNDGTAPKGRYVRPVGLDFTEGDVLLKAGRVLSARDIGLAAAMNVPWLQVHRRPRIALLATGDEVVMPGDPIGPNQIVSSNGLALSSFIVANGGQATDLGIAPDKADALRSMAAGAQGSDMLVTTGGASVGEHDLVQKVLGDIGLEVNFWRIAMRPGKPLIFGHIGNTLLLGLPGNPVSALVCAIIFLTPALHALQGIKQDRRPTDTAILTQELEENDERQDYLRATLARGEDGIMLATAMGKQDSSVFSGLAHADCLIVRAPFAPLAVAGTAVTILRLGGGLMGI